MTKLIRFVKQALIVDFVQCAVEDLIPLYGSEGFSTSATTPNSKDRHANIVGGR